MNNALYLLLMFGGPGDGEAETPVGAQLHFTCYVAPALSFTASLQTALDATINVSPAIRGTVQ